MEDYWFFILAMGGDAPGMVPDSVDITEPLRGHYSPRGANDDDVLGSLLRKVFRARKRLQTLSDFENL